MTNYLTVKELSKILKLSMTKTYELVNQSDFPKIRIGGSIRIPENNFWKYMEHNVYKNI